MILIEGPWDVDPPDNLACFKHLHSKTNPFRGTNYIPYKNQIVCKKCVREMEKEETEELGAEAIKKYQDEKRGIVYDKTIEIEAPPGIEVLARQVKDGITVWIPCNGPQPAEGTYILKVKQK